MHRFFADERGVVEGAAYLNAEDAGHALRVLRLESGDEVELVCAPARYRAKIDSTEGGEVRLRVIEKLRDTEARTRVTLYQGLPKADKMEFIVQKLVELGAYRIVPVALKRSVVHLDEKKAKARQARWQSIAEAAAKQSKRRIVPEVGAVCTLKEALEQTKQMDLKLIPYELSEGMMRTRKLIESAAPGQEIGVFIGPEGGFEEAEVELAMQSGFMPVTLGKRILRTETAGLTVMAWLMYQLEDSGIS